MRVSFGPLRKDIPHLCMSAWEALPTCDQILNEFLLVCLCTELVVPVVSRGQAVVPIPANGAPSKRVPSAAHVCDGTAFGIAEVVVFGASEACRDLHGCQEIRQVGGGAATEGKDCVGMPGRPVIVAPTAFGNSVPIAPLLPVVQDHLGTGARVSCRRYLAVVGTEALVQDPAE